MGQSTKFISIYQLSSTSPAAFILRNHRQRITITRCALLRFKKVQSKIFGLNQNILILAQICFGSIEGQGMSIGYCYIGKGFLINFFTFLDQKVQNIGTDYFLQGSIFFSIKTFCFFHSLGKDWIMIIYLIRKIKNSGKIR